MQPETKKIVIECECGTHLLHVQSDIDQYEVNVPPVQTFYLSMFYYGIENHKRKWRQRLKIAFNYLKTGKMFSDQLCLTPSEAKKLSDFINNNLLQIK